MKRILFQNVQGLLRGCGKAAASVGKMMRSQRFACLLVMFFVGFGVMLAQGGGGVDMTTGTSALDEVTDNIAQYIDPVRKVIYAIAAIVAIGGGISVYIKMNNEEQDVKKSIMMIVGACIFLIAAATALPAFFGYNGE